MTEVEQQAPAPTTEAPAKEEVVEEKKVEAEAENKEEKKDEEKKEDSEKDEKVIEHDVLLHFPEWFTKKLQDIQVSNVLFNFQAKKEKKEKVKKVKEPKEPAPPPPPPVHKKDFEKDIVYLYQFPRCPKLPNISPKCLKVETWLKLHGIKYEVGQISLCLT